MSSEQSGNPPGSRKDKVFSVAENMRSDSNVAQIADQLDVTSLIEQEGPRQHVREKPFEVFLRYEEDVAKAYRDYYRDQVVNDKRNELGRFLFGVSFTTLGFIVSVLKLSSSISLAGSVDVSLLVACGGFLLLSAMFGLRLAVPKNQDVNPTTLELVELHRANSIELSRISLLWFFSWIAGLVLGLTVIFT
ncbi:hypothetical protein DJ031_04230 [bacterium endosymbiont of Escarpia laminata]|nr:MAG: hypothetical protein DJ031_04230 [bacterium endosymbiont of Escarpia laminata]